MVLKMGILQLESIKVEWLGHASFRITDGEIIYIDPYKPPKDMKKSNLILVTHDHYDHCDVNNIKALISATGVIIAPASCSEQLAGMNVKVVTPGDNFEINGIVVEVVSAYNTNKFSSPGEPYHKKGGCVGYVITIDGKRIYHAGDTDFIEEMKNLKNIDVALIPIGGVFTMDDKEAAQAANAIKPKIVVPMHYNTFDKIMADVNYFASMVDAGIEVRVLATDDKKS